MIGIYENKSNNWFLLHWSLIKNWLTVCRDPSNAKFLGFFNGQLHSKIADNGSQSIVSIDQGSGEFVINHFRCCIPIADSIGNVPNVHFWFFIRSENAIMLCINIYFFTREAYPSDWDHDCSGLDNLQLWGHQLNQQHVVRWFLL